MNLYITADRVGEPSGGGAVTLHESEALKSLGSCEVWSRDWFKASVNPEPWKWDTLAWTELTQRGLRGQELPKLAHFYAGTFTQTVRLLKEYGCKVTYTAAAHDVGASRREHEKLGGSFDYPHLTDPELWKRYVGGYLEADAVVCPSSYSADIMASYGCKGTIRVIPHGCHLPESVAPLPKKFVLGYLGSYGPDKGVIYLLRAWRKLALKDSLLVLGGRDSTHPMVRQMVENEGGGNVCLLGWVNDVTDFYNGISCYIQPSVTEGFGCEVLEAMAHGRPILCSRGAGACDLVPKGNTFPPCDVDVMAAKIKEIKTGCNGPAWSEAREIAARHTWDKIEKRYVAMWKGLL